MEEKSKTKTGEINAMCWRNRPKIPPFFREKQQQRESEVRDITVTYPSLPITIIQSQRAFISPSTRREIIANSVDYLVPYTLTIDR